jgi:hypothetical protein
MDRQVWLVDHKATLSGFSPLNLDGSAWILGVCVLAANSDGDATKRLDEYLKSKEMELIEIYDIREFSAAEFEDDSRRSKQIKNAARTVRIDGETCYVFARTSEALAESANDE